MKRISLILIVFLLLGINVYGMTENQFKAINFDCDNQVWLLDNMNPYYLTYSNGKTYEIRNGEVYTTITYKTIGLDYLFYYTNYEIYMGQSKEWKVLLNNNPIYANKLFKQTSNDYAKERITWECMTMKQKQESLNNNDVSFNDITYN